MIVFDHVSKTYPNGYQALKDINLTIEQGEFVAIIGLSGAGKSTLIRTINRMHDITDGTLTVDGVNVMELKGARLRQFRRNIGMIFQSFNLVTRTTVIKNVLTSRVPELPFWRALLGAYPKKDKLEALEALDKVGILDKAFVRADQLSGGQQQRLCIARALALRPRLLLMDEPTSALDPIATNRIEELILELKKEIAILIVTHNMGQAARISDRSMFMYLGELVEYDRTDKMFTNPSDQRTEDYLQGNFG